MLISFELSMPNSNSWNGKWSGESKLYVKVKSFVSKKDVLRAESMINQGYYRYNFGDGWIAGISVKQVDSKEAARLRRKSSGFCGYDWMIDSIINKGLIKAPKREQ
jgi:hypothetical protein